MKENDKELVLSNIRVLDLSRYLAGPLCGMMLADMGAEVIKVEPPGGAVDRTWGILGTDGETLTYKILGRNKKSTTLNLSTNEGMEIFREMVKSSDVVIHNFPPGTTLEAQLNYENLSKVSSSIILAVVSGYGLNGPDAQNVGFDFVTQARAGAMVLNGFQGDPPLKTTVPYIDCCSGVMAALGILLALYHREKTGKGQLVDVALFDIASFITQNLGTLLYYQVYGEIRKQFGNFGFASFMTCLKATDGQVMIVASSSGVWKRFVTAIGREELSTDPRCINDMSRSFNAALIDPIIQEWAKDKTTDEILDKLQAARVACAKVNAVDQLLSDPQSLAREMVVDVEYAGLGKISIPGIPIKLSLTPGKIRTLAPKVGENNKEIYCGLLGYDLKKFNSLKERGII
ncbi:MAG: CoA transferase [Proteobacteria bacterium]|nr:CoA transferase [Pseudomonadota bacterium]